ncbi:uracil-DNA glycosylase [Hyphomicrobium sp. D-2]|uniref:uracil-DNA glycosylase n=1 Tax=Hyphomicrobium sp. D-2 TaxID=3041621 RepID=UPI002454217C|nr:uracil-DNA glycosylase [Hyphomicrobium sp. D-2]MDH4983766.1 uracil-DNA glycosylase [Hyphomicrobium sp. D-2]
MSSDSNRDIEAQRAAGRILAWYAAMGVDAAISDTAVDWLARGEQAPGQGFRLHADAGQAPQSAQAFSQGSVAARGPGAPARPLPTGTPQRTPYAGTTTSAQPARQFSVRPAAAPADAAPVVDLANINTLADLGSALAAFDGCGLKATAKNLCFYRGAERAPLMIIGEAPGRDEDLAGKPFVGRAGQLLDRMLAAIGVDETNVHITNIVYWRPPGNRTPTPQEAIACRPFLEKQIALVGPRIVLALGGSAAKQLFDVADGIMRLRGKWRPFAVNGHEYKSMATLHPAYLLRTPAAKNMAWRDLLNVKAALKG